MAWDENNVSDVGYRNKEKADFSIARALSYVLDREKSLRLKSLTCNYCWYFSSQLGGQAFTAWKCRVCDKEQQWPNTSIPLICEKCAKHHTLCQRCGSDLHLRVKRSNANHLKPSEMA